MAVASITSLSAAETGKAALHPRVQAALGWEIPINECGGQPRLSRAGKDIDEGDDVKRRFDVDSNTLGRHKRRQNRWIKCMTRYNQGIVDSIEMLRSSAQYGLTEPQAKIILQKMVDAQAVLTAQRPSPPQ
jgi:hypothetical protein